MLTILSILVLLALRCEGKFFPSHILVSANEPPLIQHKTIKPFYNSYMSYNVFNLLSDRLNLSYTMTSPVDLLYGGNVNGNWTGIVGQVYRKEADFGAQATNMNLLRYQAVDGTYPFLFDTSKILIPIPTETETFLAPLQPFSSNVWVCLMTALVAVSVASKFTLDKTRTTLFSDCALATLSLFTGQSFCYISNARNTAVRLVLTGGCLAAVIIINSYTTILFSILTISRYDPLVSSLEDLETSSILPSTVRGTTYEILFMNASEGIYKKIGDRMRQNPQAILNWISDGREAAATGNMAFLFPEKYLDSLISEDYQLNGRCRICKAKKDFYPLNFGFILPKKSPLKTSIDKQIIYMHEYGFIKYFDNRLQVRSACDTASTKSRETKAKSLQLKQLGSIFVFYLIGICIAFVVFLLERFLRRC